LTTVLGSRNLLQYATCGQASRHRMAVFAAKRQRLKAAIFRACQAAAVLVSFPPVTETGCSAVW
jgi:hypothetical protein